MLAAGHGQLSETKWTVTAHTMSILSTYLPSPPDIAARQPITTAAFLVPYSLHYLLAVLAILPQTFNLKVALFPVILWQSWKCAVERDVSVAFANTLGFESSARLRHWNFALVVRFQFLSSNVVTFSLTLEIPPGLVVQCGDEVPRLDNC